jgi:hypothetical protein
MFLNTDYITPAELTGYVRAASGDLPINQTMLAAWLPNRLVDDLQYRYTRGGEALTQAATYRAYDAESPIGSRPGLTRVTGELPPISRKIRLGEYDRLRQRRVDGLVRGAIQADAVRMVRSVAMRIEVARGQALYTGKVTIDENGVKQEADFGRAAGHTTAPGTLWSNTASATPLTNLLAWMDTYVAANGDAPGTILTSRRVLSYLLLNAEIRGLLATNAVTAGRVTIPALNDLLGAHGLPNIRTYDVTYTTDAGSTARVIPDDRVLLLPAPGDAGDADSGVLGNTLYGTTAESLEPDFGLEGEEAGIVAGAYSTKDPVAVWTKAAAIALPVLANPDLTFCADVA